MTKGGHKDVVKRGRKEGRMSLYEVPLLCKRGSDDDDDKKAATGAG